MEEVSTSKDKEESINNLQQEIAKQEKKLRELIEQDKKENSIIQELNKARRELIQAEKDLVIYQQKEIDLNKAAEKKYSTIPMLKEKIIRLEEEVSQNMLKRYFANEEDISLTIGKILVDEQQKLFFLPAILQQRIKGQE